VSRPVAIVLLVVGIVVTVVAVDVLFFRDHFWPRLMANIGIVLIFGAFALRYIKRT
jgi:hypothetical protein